jgi:hypothetical protein
MGPDLGAFVGVRVGTVLFGDLGDLAELGFELVDVGQQVSAGVQGDGTLGAVSSAVQPRVKVEDFVGGFVAES